MDFQPWQLVFFAVGIPSVAVGLVFALTTREPARTHSGGALVPSFVEVVAYARTNAALYGGLLAGAGLLQAIGYSWTAWGPEIVRRAYALPIEQAGLVFGVGGLLAAFGGTLMFPLVSQRLASAGRPDALALTSMVGVVGGALFAVCAMWQSAPTPFFLLATASMFCIVGGANNVIVGMQTLAPPRMRATLVACVLLSVTVLGLCIGPPVSAAIASIISPAGDALAAGIAGVSVLIALPCIALFAWSRRGLHDSAIASQSPVSPASTVSRAAAHRSPAHPLSPRG